jgi:hypothetical protein
MATAPGRSLMVVWNTTVVGDATHIDTTSISPAAHKHHPHQHSSPMAAQQALTTRWCDRPLQHASINITQRQLMRAFVSHWLLLDLPINWCVLVQSVHHPPHEATTPGKTCLAKRHCSHSSSGIARQASSAVHPWRRAALYMRHIHVFANSLNSIPPRPRALAQHAANTAAACSQHDAP